MAALHGDDIPDRQRCSATGKKSGVRCKRYAIPGGTVCEYHGGAAPQVMAKARERVERAQAEAAALKLGVPVETTPEQALLDEVQRTAGMVAFYGARVQEIDDQDREDLVWGVTKEKTGGEDFGTTTEAKPNIWLTLWNDERDRLVRVCATALKAGIEERRVKIAEAQGAMLAAVIRRILDRLNLTEDQTGLVAVVVPEELRALVAA